MRVSKPGFPGFGVSRPQRTAKEPLSMSGVSAMGWGYDQVMAEHVCNGDFDLRAAMA